MGEGHEGNEAHVHTMTKKRKKCNDDPCNITKERLEGPSPHPKGPKKKNKKHTQKQKKTKKKQKKNTKKKKKKTKKKHTHYLKIISYKGGNKTHLDVKGRMMKRDRHEISSVTQLSGQ